MKRLALRKRHQVISHFLRDHVLEQIGEVRDLAVERREIESSQILEVISNARLIGIKRVDLVDSAQGENASDHAGSFQSELVCWQQAIDAASDNSLHGIGEIRACRSDPGATVHSPFSTTMT